MAEDCSPQESQRGKQYVSYDVIWFINILDPSEPIMLEMEGETAWMSMKDCCCSIASNWYKQNRTKQINFAACLVAS